FPAFAPDGSGIAYVDLPCDGAPRGALRLIDFDPPSLTATNDRVLVTAGNDPPQSCISFPSVGPRGRAVAFARGQGGGKRRINHCTAKDPNGNCTASWSDYTNRAQLYLADAKTPGVEVALASLNGDTYPFVAGDRDRRWNFEPTFAPVAAGGYFWVVFTSRRTYGNVLTGDKTMVKQLWVAAIDQSPKPGKDPSHPAFHLTGQAPNLALRGYWALAPCKSNG